MNVADLTVMWLRVLFALGWLVAISVVALPAGRRVLSERARTRLDQRLPGLSRSAAWFAGLVILTGAYHLVRSVPYRVPLSIPAAQQAFRLPCAEPYFMALAVKLVAFASTIPVVVSLAAHAPRLAVGSHDEAARPAGPPVDREDP